MPYPAMIRSGLYCALSSIGVLVTDFGSVLAGVFTVLSYMGSASCTVFSTLVFMSGITAAIPYGFLRASPDQVAAPRRVATAHPPAWPATSSRP
jgi:hypothetical protein